MTTHVNAIALHTVNYVDADGNQAVALPTDKGPFRLTKEAFDELAELGAVRKATKADREDADEDDDGESPPPPPTGLEARHKGGGKFQVTRNDEVLSGDELFDGKAAAEAWIAASSETGGDLL